MATAARTKNPRDVTGRKAAIMAEAHAEELKARAKQMSTVTAAVDVEPDADGPEISVGDVEVGTPTKKLRVNTDVEDLTFGAGTNYSFYRGQTYSVPAALWEHLEEKGLVWH